MIRFIVGAVIVIAGLRVGSLMGIDPSLSEMTLVVVVLAIAQGVEEMLP